VRAAARAQTATTKADPILSRKATQAVNLLIWVGMVVGCAVLLACSYIYLKRKKEHRRLLTGELMAPGEGPETTLAVTDIQVGTPCPDVDLVTLACISSDGPMESDHFQTLFVMSNNASARGRECHNWAAKTMATCAELHPPPPRTPRSCGRSCPPT
jgi:hypothetical protein